jgi:hypothetical protein
MGTNIDEEISEGVVLKREEGSSVYHILGPIKNNNCSTNSPTEESIIKT